MHKKALGWLAGMGACALVSVTGVAAANAAGTTFVGPSPQVTTIGSTVPGNGDVNPYGVAVVHRSLGNLVAGDVLISNFNDIENQQGTGTTIVQVSPSGSQSVFSDVRLGRGNPCVGGVGLTTALAVTSRGWVIVGSLPTSNGTSPTAARGCLIVLDSMGNVAETISGSMINGPWDMAALDMGATADLFVTNVLNGTVAGDKRVVNQGTVVRVDLSLPFQGGGVPTVTSQTVIGSGFGEQTNSAALVVGPTGVGLAHDGTLYVADTLDNRIAAIPNAVSRANSAGSGRDVTAGGSLNSPLGLTVAPGGDILTVNGGDGNLVETTPSGQQAATVSLDQSGSPPGAGALFGLAVAPNHQDLYFVDDATNTLNLLSPGV